MGRRGDQRKRETHDLSSETLRSFGRHFRNKVGKVLRRSQEPRYVRNHEVVREVPNVLCEIGDGSVLVRHVRPDQPATSPARAKMKRRGTRKVSCQDSEVRNLLLLRRNPGRKGKKGRKRRTRVPSCKWRPVRFLQSQQRQLPTKRSNADVKGKSASEMVSLKFAFDLLSSIN